MDDVNSFIVSIVGSVVSELEETNNTAMIKACSAKISKACKALPAVETKIRRTTRSNPKLYEFTCDKESNLGKNLQQYGIQHARLHKDFINLADARS